MKAEYGELMLITLKRMPRAWAVLRASDRLPSEEYGPGIATPSTLALPNASAASVTVSAESMPPLRPTSAV